MESSQLRKISIIGLSALCLSPVEFFSNKLFEDRKVETTQVVMSVNEMKLQPNYLSNNYELFNPEIKTTSEDIEELVNKNKEKEIIEYENKLESEKAKKAEQEKKERERKEQERKEQERKEEERRRAAIAAREASTSTTTGSQNTANNAQVREVVAQPDTDIANSVVNYALQFVGNPYVPNGTDLYNGVDCSGFTMKVYEHFGYSLPHRSTVQATYGTSVSVDQMAPGDLIFYGYNGRVSHVAIYTGNGRIVHAATSSQGIVTAGYQIMPIITVRRILN